MLNLNSIFIYPPPMLPVSHALSFIPRCIKPNSDKVASKFVPTMVYEQLIYSGVFEAVKIRQAGYPLRMTVKEFLGRYSAVVPRSLQKEIEAETGQPLSAPETLKKVFARLPLLLGDSRVVAKDFQLGKTKVFCKANAQRALDAARRFAYAGICVTIQKHYRGHLTRKQIADSKRYQKEMKEFSAQYPLYSDTNKNAMVLFGGSLEGIETKIVETNKLLARAYQAYPVPPETRRFEELMAKVLEERDLYRNMPELKMSLNVRELDQATALMGRLKMQNEVRFLLRIIMY